MAKQRWRDYQSTNQEESIALLDSPRSHNSVENEYHWRSTCKCSNHIWHGPQIENINQPIVFDFDPDAIQVMEDVEFEELPEAVNREIRKNSEEIIFENGEGISTRTLAKLHNGKSKMQEQDSLMQRALTNKEMKETILKNSQEIISEAEKRNSLENIIRLNEKSGQEDVSENKKGDFLERMIIKLNTKSADVLTNQEVFQEKEILGKKLIRLDEGKDDSLKNSRHIEEEKLALVKDSKDIRHQIRQPQHEFGKKYKIKSNGFARKDNEACLEKERDVHNKRYQLIVEQKSSREFNKSLSDNPSTAILSHKIDRRAFGDRRKNIITQLVVSNPDHKNPERNTSLNEKQESSKEFNKSLIDDPSIENNRKSFKTFGENANRLIVLNRDQRKRESFSSEERKRLKEFNRSFSDNSVIIDDTRSFREFRKNTIGSMSTIKILEEDKKSPREIKKYPVKSLDCLNGSSISRPRLNCDFLRQENDDHQEQYDNVRMENEKALRKPLLNRPSKIAIRNKLYINNNPWSLSPVSDLSPESGFCEESLDISSREPRLFTRKMLKNIDILGRKNNSLESNVLQKNAIDEVNHLKEGTINHVAQTSTHVDNSSVSLHVNLPYKNSIENHKNSVKHSDALNIGEQIICTNYGIVDEVNKKYRYPNTSSRRLISNVDNPEETPFIEQFVFKQNSIQNIDKIAARQKHNFPNIACKYSAEDIHCSKGFDDATIFGGQVHNNNDNVIKNERKIMDFSNSDIIALDRPKRCNSALIAEQIVYENEKAGSKRQVRNSLNNSISCENLINDFDHSKQRDDAFGTVNIV